MAIRIAEWFGHDIENWSQPALDDREAERCPFLNAPCTKTFNDGTRSGVCSMSPAAGRPIVTCPNRLYAEDYTILKDVAAVAFGPDSTIIHPSIAKTILHDGNNVVAFGKRFGSELRLPQRGGRGSYFVDWILARLSASGLLSEFVAVEVQTIDSTGSYKPQVEMLKAGAQDILPSKAGFNWENVNKRILPQLIYKGHVLRSERLCTKGLFFVCPTQVYERIQVRLGGNLRPYENLQPGSITFRWYELGSLQPLDRELVFTGQFSTTVDQVALAFTSPFDLPPAGVYENAILRALDMAE